MWMDASQRISSSGACLDPEKDGVPTFWLAFFVKRLDEEGFLSTKILRTILGKELKATTFEGLARRLAVMATNVEEGVLASFDQGPLLDPLSASAAIPGLFQAVEMDGKPYVGGEVIIASNVQMWPHVATKGDPRNVAVWSYHIMRYYLNETEASQADVMIQPDLSGVTNVFFLIVLLYARGKWSCL